MTTEIAGQVHVSMRSAECYGGRRVHLRIEGLPSWLMSILSEAGPWVHEATSYRGTGADSYGPSSMTLGSSRVVETREPSSPTSGTGEGT